MWRLVRVLAAATLAGGLTVGVTGAARAADAGDLDPSWGSSGLSESTPGTGRAAAVDSQGRVYAAAAADAAGGPGTVVRYDASGSIDPTFTPPNLPNQHGDRWSRWRLVVQAVDGDERLLAVDGSTVRRFTTTGAPDGSFGDAGRAETRVEPGVVATTPVDLELSPDGSRIVYLGHAGQMAGVGIITPRPITLLIGGFAVASGLSVSVLDADGRHDPSFGAAGATALIGPGVIACAVGCPYAGARIVPTDLEVGSDGSIFIGGHLEAGTWPSMEPILVKLRPDGTLDPDFGVHGVLRGPALSEPAVSSGSLSGVSALAEQPGGGLLVATRHCHDEGWCTVRADVRRLDGRGAVDTSFGNAGVTTLPQGFFNVDGLLLDGGTGALYPVQDSYDGHAIGYYAGAVARLGSDGLLDATFGDGGAIVTAELAGIPTLDVLGRIYVPRSGGIAGPMVVTRHLGSPSDDVSDLVTTWGTVSEKGTGSPIARASVRCDTAVATTGADGRYTLELAPGAYICTASADGYRSIKARREVAEGAGPFDYELRRQR